MALLCKLFPGEWGKKLVPWQTTAIIMKLGRWTFTIFIWMWHSRAPGDCILSRETELWNHGLDSKAIWVSQKATKNPSKPSSETPKESCSYILPIPFFQKAHLNFKFCLEVTIYEITNQTVTIMNKSLVMVNFDVYGNIKTVIQGSER